jgi:hypothetical protein
MAHGLSRIRKRTQRRESQGYIMKRKPHDIGNMFLFFNDLLTK